MESKFQIIAAGLTILVLSVIVIAVYSQLKFQKQTEELFTNILNPMCKKASTPFEVREALNALFDECHYPDGGLKIHKGWLLEYYELKALLEGKLYILESAVFENEKPSGVIPLN